MILANQSPMSLAPFIVPLLFLVTSSCYWADASKREHDPVEDIGGQIDDSEEKEPIDADGDSYPQEQDCDDNDASIHPGATERCDKALTDEDCDGLIDDDDTEVEGTSIWYQDLDKDSHGDPETSFEGCHPPAGWVGVSDDCDDLDASTWPGAPETCGDGVLNGCEEGEEAVSLATLACLGGEISLASASMKMLGENTTDETGEIVAAAGDVNGDLQGDMLVSSRFSSAGGNWAGSVYLITEIVRGEVDLGASYARLRGEAAYDYALSVAGAGDTDSDGLADILVGAIGNDEGGSGAGAAYLVLGGVSGELSLSVATASFIGESAGDSAGQSVSSAGHFNEDLVGDILVGASNQRSGGAGAGAAYVLHGPLSGTVDLGDAQVKLVGEEAGDAAGSALCLAGDTDSDGLDDILVGAPRSDAAASDAGAIYVVQGSLSGVVDLSAASALLLGQATGDLAGTALSGAGDLNDDGYADILVGAPGASTGGYGAGAAYVLLGPFLGTSSLSDAHGRLEGDGAVASVGVGVASAGDVNGDGLPDTLISSNQRDRGANYLYFGAWTGSTSLAKANAVFVGESKEDQADSAAGLGDLDLDGFGELLFGARGNDSAGSNAGAAYLVLSGDRW